MERRNFQAREMDRKQEVTMSYASACAEVRGVLCARKERQVFRHVRTAKLIHHVMLFKLYSSVSLYVCT